MEISDQGIEARPGNNEGHIRFIGLRPPIAQVLANHERNLGLSTVHIMNDVTSELIAFLGTRGRGGRVQKMEPLASLRSIGDDNNAKWKIPEWAN